jgi:hypothetical protein
LVRCLYHASSDHGVDARSRQLYGKSLGRVPQDAACLGVQKGHAGQTAIDPPAVLCLLPSQEVVAQLKGDDALGLGIDAHRLAHQ